MLRQIAWLPFQIPLLAPLTTAHGVVAARSGVLVRLIADDGSVGLGEGAPLPGFGPDTLPDILRVLAQLARSLPGQPTSAVDRLLARRDPGRPGVAAASAALDTALCDLQARREGIPVGQLLGGTAVRALAVNALIGAADPAEAAHAARRAVGEGFRCVKLKVGVADSVAAELDRIGRVREALGSEPALRLDANGAWDVDTALTIIRAAERFDLELVEQPVAAADLPGLARIRAAVTTRIAADESAATPEQARQVIERGAADVLVVKPICLGGLRPARQVIQRAEEAGLSVVVTTTVDAGVGVAAACHLAMTRSANALACGLATGDLLVADLVTEPARVREGMIWPPIGPGLGVALDPEELVRYGAGWQDVEG